MKTTRFLTLLALLLMAGGVTMQAQNRELPTEYWTDVVNQQPSGYIVDAYGDVHLYSAEALAWLISTVNGLNGQEADDFNGKKVTLEANVDMSAAIWTAIAQGTNYGDPNPDRLRFSGTLNGNGFIIEGITLYLQMPDHYNMFSSFLGTLMGARIENVVLRHAYAEGRNFRDGKFFSNAETLETESETRQTIIDHCFVEFDEIYRDPREENCALFGYNNDGIIKNCMAYIHKMDYEGSLHERLSLLVWNNNGTIENCASIADSLNVAMEIYPGIATNNYSTGVIENCYSYIGDWFGEWYPFEVVARMGLCWQNWGVIKNCYYNTWSYNEHGMWHDEEAVVASYGGEITETMNFEPTADFQPPYWLFKNPVNIYGNDGSVYTTDNLFEAMQDWVFGQENGEEDYDYWCTESSSSFPNMLPGLCNLDITDIPEDEAVAELVSVYPNPAMEKVTIDGAEVTEVQVYNALGQMMKTVKNSNEVSLEGLSQGVYMLRITDADGENRVARVVVR